MKVILTADVKGLGKKGELVEVSDGHGRNFLLPRSLAVPANAQAMNELKNREASAAHHQAEELAAARKYAAALEGKTVTLTAKAGTAGRLFGAVTVKEVSEAIQKNFGIELDKRKITMPEIKACGGYDATIKFCKGVSATVKILVAEE